MNRIPYPLSDELRAFFPLLSQLVATLEAGVEDKLYAFASLEDLDQFQSHVSQTEMTGLTVDRGIVLRILAGHRNFEFGTNNFDEAALSAAAETLRTEALAYLETRDDPKTYTPPTWSNEPIDTFADPIRDLVLTDGALPSADTPVHFGNVYDPAISESTSNAETAARAKALKEAIAAKGGDQLASAGCLIRRKVKSRLFVDRTRVRVWVSIGNDRPRGHHRNRG